MGIFFYDIAKALFYLLEGDYAHRRRQKEAEN